LDGVVRGEQVISIYEKRPWLKNYPEGVPHDIEIGNETAIGDFMRSACQKPDAPAVHYFDHTLSYGDIDRLSNSFAAALENLGVVKGDRVILVLQNIPQFLISTYAAWKIGAIVVPLNPMYKEKELSYFCENSNAKIFITLEEIASQLEMSFLMKLSIEKVITTSHLDFLGDRINLPKLLNNVQKNPVPDCIDMLELINRYQGARIDCSRISAEDIAYLTYTSGTTGSPKGAMNTHGNIAFNARVYQVMQRIDETDVILGVAPLFHVTGEVAHLATAALAGIPVVLYYRFDPAETLRLIERWKITTTVASITVYIALMNHPDITKTDLSSFTKAYSGGAPVSEAVVNQFEKMTGQYLYNVYGMTETNSPSHIVPLGKRAPVDQESGALSVGIPVPSCIMKIVDLKEDTNELPPDQIGEIIDSGPIIVPGYWQQPEETQKAIRNGWLYTGDVGKMDDNGWFYVVDRKKDLIIASGYKVWPRDVEDVIYQHPAVRETAVVGVPDSYRGETVKAYVALKNGEENSIQPEDIISFSKERLAAYKYPREVEIVSEIPKTLTGKILRRMLRHKEK
jgi:long-chain acyl-CoA synthetase